MATTTGLVQHLAIGPETTCVFIGPTPAVAELLFLRSRTADSVADSAFKSVMIDALAQALASRREVTAHHEDMDAQITELNLR